MTRGFVTCHLSAVLGKHGITRKTLSLETGLTESALWEMSTGRRQPTAFWILAILDGLERLTGRRYDVREVWAPVRAHGLRIVRRAA